MSWIGISKVYHTVSMYPQKNKIGGNMLTWDNATRVAFSNRLTLGEYCPYRYNNTSLVVIKQPGVIKLQHDGIWLVEYSRVSRLLDTLRSIVIRMCKIVVQHQLGELLAGWWRSIRYVLQGYDTRYDTVPYIGSCRCRLLSEIPSSNIRRR